MDKTVLVTKPGTVGQKDKKLLAKWGVLLIETNDPQSVRFLTPGIELDSAGMLGAALRVLATSDEMKSAKKMQQEFVTILMKMFEPANREAR